ncbi:hypothetical protein DsansV1_C32g0222981 [Dioscorea sansibarensis]
MYVCACARILALLEHLKKLRIQDNSAVLEEQLIPLYTKYNFLQETSPFS